MVTIIVRYNVLSRDDVKFKEWYAEMHRLVEQSPGFISKEFFPPANEHGHVTTILRFDSLINAGKWMHSEQRLNMLNKVSEDLLTNIEEGIHTQNVFWFNTKSSIQKKWKQVAVTFVAIFPLTILVPHIVAWISAPFFQNSWIIRTISVFTIVCLMVFRIMPFMIRITRKWLE